MKSIRSSCLDNPDNMVRFFFFFFFLLLLLLLLVLLVVYSHVCSESEDYQKLQNRLRESKMSEEAKSFILALTNPDPTQRLGVFGDVSDIMAHPWFKGFDWDLLARGQMPAPYRPDPNRKNVDVLMTLRDLEDQLVGREVSFHEIADEKQILFDGFEFNTELSEQDILFLSKTSKCCHVM
jgi:serine/threonine protein kinase